MVLERQQLVETFKIVPIISDDLLQVEFQLGDWIERVHVRLGP